MAGMQGIGRLFLPVPIAAGAGVSLKNASAISYVCTGADTFTLTVASTFGGSYATPGNIIAVCYTSTATNGTAAWVKAVAGGTGPLSGGASNVVTIASGAVQFTVFGSQLADPKAYVKVSVGSGGLVQAYLHDLTVQRGPAATLIPGA